MHMLYNSDAFTVVRFDLSADGAAPGLAHENDDRGGYEIVDKFARKEIFLQGDMARSFKSGVEALVGGQGETSQEEMDDYIKGFAALMQQPLVLH